jgi:hypothetical protein
MKCDRIREKHSRSILCTPCTTKIRDRKKGREKGKPPRWRQNTKSRVHPYLVILRRHLTLSAFAFKAFFSSSPPSSSHRLLWTYRLAYCIWSLFRFLKLSASLSLSLGYPFPLLVIGYFISPISKTSHHFLHSPDVFGLIFSSANS